MSLKPEYAVANFEIVTDDFFDELEMLNINDDDGFNNESNDDVIDAGVGSPEFKMPNLKDFETKTKTTPKAVKPTLSQSPVLVSRLKKKKTAISSSDEEDEEDLSVIEPPKKVVKLKRTNKFIDDEAELSGLASDDELDNEDLDAFDESFVDDATQKEELTHFDQKAIYLQSIR